MAVQAMATGILGAPCSNQEFSLIQTNYCQVELESIIFKKKKISKWNGLIYLSKWGNNEVFSVPEKEEKETLVRIQNLTILSWICVEDL